MLKVVGASWLQTKISSYVLGILGLLAVIAVFLEIDRKQDDGTYAATVFYTDKSGYRIQFWGQSNELSTLPLGVARAYYRQDISTTGWAQLEIETDPSYKDSMQASAAGMLEGALTWNAIYTHLKNTVNAECAESEKECDRVRVQLEKAVNIDKNNAAKYEDDDPFWHQVGLFYAQIEGIYQGWRYSVERNSPDCSACVERSDLYWLNAMSEIHEIKQYLNVSSTDKARVYLPGLSSALLRVVSESETGKKVYVAHNTAGRYNTMIRILKRYQFNYHTTDADDSPLVPSTSVQFSGYPAAITSHDDMYVLSGNNSLMAVTGTTLNNFNGNLWKNVNIVDQVPMGPRLSAANRLSKDVSSWSRTMAQNNSGTACKQWMVVNLMHFNKSAEPVPLVRNDKKKNFKDSDRVSKTIENNKVKHTVVHHGNSGKVKGLFWLVEQIPGQTHSGDLSNTLLKQGYWATYGLPFFKDIAANTHVPDKEAKFGNVFSYAKSPRAEIFKTNAKNLTNIDTILKLMRTNNMTLLDNRIRNHYNSIEEKKLFEKTRYATKEQLKCSDGTLVEKQMDCIMNEREYWVNLAVRGDLAHQFQEAFGVIDTKVISGNSDGISEFSAISGPTYTAPLPVPKQDINKGNIALMSEEDSNITQEDDKDLVQPFRWSESRFSADPHETQPDSFAFTPFQPRWVW